MHSSNGTASRSSARTTARSSSPRATSFSSHDPLPVGDPDGGSVVGLDERKLYLITPARADLEEFLAAAVRGGVDLVQVREKEFADSALLESLARAREITRRLEVPLVVNDRPDLAVLCGADFVHVGQEDIPVAEARRFGVGVGLSTHAESEIDGADADYIGVGPIYRTPTKEGRPAVGLELVRYAARRARVPWFAIGGIDASNAAEVIAAGATRIAVVRAIGDAEDPERAARELRVIVEA
jgi:thiamine-phosphate pyrophosphorylase